MTTSPIVPITRKDFMDRQPFGQGDGFAKAFYSKADTQNLWPNAHGIFVGGPDPEGIPRTLAAAIITSVGVREPRVANLQLVHAFNAFRGQGHGRRLCEWALPWAKSQGAQYFRVSAEPEAVGFYEKMGVKFIGKQKSGCQLSIFKIVGDDFASGVIDMKDPIIRRAVDSRAKGGVVEIFPAYLDGLPPRMRPGTVVEKMEPPKTVTLQGIITKDQVVEMQAEKPFSTRAELNKGVDYSNIEMRLAVSSPEQFAAQERFVERTTRVGEVSVTESFFSVPPGLLEDIGRRVLFGVVRKTLIDFAGTVSAGEVERAELTRLLEEALPQAWAPVPAFRRSTGPVPAPTPPAPPTPAPAPPQAVPQAPAPVPVAPREKKEKPPRPDPVPFLNPERLERLRRHRMKYAANDSPPRAFNIRGTSGSGKTYTVKTFMALWNENLDKGWTRTILTQDNKRVDGYLLSRPGARDIYVVGSYEGATGGADNISGQGALDRIYDLVERQVTEEDRHVLFEGLIVCSDFRRTKDLVSEGFPLEILMLSTTLADCEKNINSRRAARGAEPLADQGNTRQKYEGNLASISRFQEAGVTVFQLEPNQIISLLKTRFT